MSDIGKNFEIYLRTSGYLSRNERYISVRHEELDDEQDEFEDQRMSMGM